MELSIVIPALNEAHSLASLLPRVEKVVAQLTPLYEVIVVDGGSKDGTVRVAQANGARVVSQEEPGYGGALRAGFQVAQARYICTLDADLSHDPEFLYPMWQARKEAEIVIASRYVPGGSARMPWERKILSRILNLFFGYGLSIPVKDLSSGFRLYQASCLRRLPLRSTDFDILMEVLAQCYARGWRAMEVPFRYLPRRSGSSHARLFKFGVSYVKTFWRMWLIRNSIRSADYDDRAFDSRIPLQRYWQRQRYRIVTGFTPQGVLTLDVGCGSSRILGGLPTAVGADIQANKLRHARKFSRPLVAATIEALPFRDDSFDCVVCSEVIEHLRDREKPFQEMRRVLKAGGALILGTPDYGKWVWRLLERLYRWFSPGGYADEHVSQYARVSLMELMNGLGFRLEAMDYVCGAEMVARFRKEAVESKLQVDGNS